KHYKDALKSKFGDAGKVMAGSEMPDFNASVADADEKIDGDKATLVSKGKKGMGDMKLKKDSDGWKVDLSDMGAQGAEMDKMFKPMAAAYDATTKDVQDGKFKTADEANTALGTKVMGAMLGAH